MIQIDNYATILEKAIIVEGESETLAKYNKEHKKKKNDREIRKEKVVAGEVIKESGTQNVFKYTSNFLALLTTCLYS